MSAEDRVSIKEETTVAVIHSHNYRVIRKSFPGFYRFHNCGKRNGFELSGNMPADLVKIGSVLIAKRMEHQHTELAPVSVS